MAVDDLQFQRFLFGVFPTYRDSPLRPAFDRIVQMGDASGIQSPLSFGGFGAICRHLGRFTSGLADALACDCLDRKSLGLLNPYKPNLSAAWLFQRAMSVPVGKRPQPQFINSLLSANFGVMQARCARAPHARSRAPHALARCAVRWVAAH